MHDNPRLLNEVWMFLAGMGIALMVLGFIAVGSAAVATLATVIFLGVVLLTGAVFQFIAAFWGRHWRGGFLHLLFGVVYFVLGAFLIENPADAAVGLTVLMAAGFLAGGVFRIVVSLADRFPGWQLMLISGLLSILLACAVWSQWPATGLWVIGLFVGVEMIASGLSWLMLAMSARSLLSDTLPE